MKHKEIWDMLPFSVAILDAISELFVFMVVRNSQIKSYLSQNAQKMKKKIIR